MKLLGKSSQVPLKADFPQAEMMVPYVLPVPWTTQMKEWSYASLNNHKVNRRNGHLLLPVWFCWREWCSLLLQQSRMFGFLTLSVGKQERTWTLKPCWALMCCSGLHAEVQWSEEQIWTHTKSSKKLEWRDSYLALAACNFACVIKEQILY